MKKKAIIFDFDGTLADSMPVLLESYNAIAPRYRLRKVKMSEIDELKKMSYREIMSSIHLRPWMLPMVVRSATRQLRQREDSLSLFDGVKTLLNDLVDSGHRVGILTSNHSDVVARVMEIHGIKKLDFIVSQRSLFAKHKAFKTLEKVYKLKPQDIVYIGDESRDVVACRKAGVEIIGVTWGFGGAQAFEKTPANKLAHTVDELESFIQEYLN